MSRERIDVMFMFSRRVSFFCSAFLVSSRKNIRLTHHQSRGLYELLEMYTSGPFGTGPWYSGSAQAAPLQCYSVVLFCFEAAFSPLAVGVRAGLSHVFVYIFD